MRAALLTILLVGCAARADDTVTSEVIDDTAEGLVSLGSASGTYGASCVARSGAWSVRLGGQAALPHPALSVVEGDAACALTLTEIDGSPVAPVIPLGASYACSASSAASLLVNARYAAGTLSLLVSDAPSATSAAVTAARASGVVAIATATINDSVLTIGKPAGTTAGMVLVAAVASENGKSASLAGWTSLGHATNTVGLDLLYKVAGASEPASYTFLMSGSCKSAGGILAIATTSASPLDVTGASAASFTASSVTTTVSGALLVGCWANIASASAPPSGMTERWDLAYSDKIALACSTQTLGAAGTTGTRAVTATGASPLSRLIAIKP